jgi:hypothetical protein
LEAELTRLGSLAQELSDHKAQQQQPVTPEDAVLCTWNGTSWQPVDSKVHAVPATKVIPQIDPSKPMS